MFCAIDHSGKMPSACRSPAHESDRAVHLPRRPSGAAAASSSAHQQLASGPGPRGRPARRPRRARPQRLAVVRACGHADHGRAAQAAVRRARRRGLDRRGPLGAAPSPRRARRAVERAGGRVGDDAAVAHHHDPVGGLEDLAEHVRDQHAGAAFGDEPAHEGAAAGRATTASSDEVGSSRITSRAGSVRDREGARDLHHLRAADRQVADDVAGADAVAGKDLVELSRDQLARRAAARPRPSGADARPACSRRRVRFGQSDSSWNTQRTPRRCAARTPQPRGRRRAPPISMRPGVGRQAAGQHVHQRRLAGAVVADEARRISPARAAQSTPRSARTAPKLP